MVFQIFLKIKLQKLLKNTGTDSASVVVTVLSLGTNFLLIQEPTLLSAVANPPTVPMSPKLLCHTLVIYFTIGGLENAVDLGVL